MNGVRTASQPRALKVVTLMLFAVQAVTTWYLIGSVVFPLLGVGCAAWLIFTGTRREMENNARFQLCAILAVAFVLKAMLAPIHVRSGAMTSLTQLAFASGQFLFVLQLVLLATSRAARRYPQVLPWLAALALICTGDVYVTDLQRTVFQGIVLLFIVLAGAFSAINRQFIPGRSHAARKTIAVGCCLLGVVLLGGWGASSLFSHERDIERLIASLVNPRIEQPRPGFSGGGRLGGVVDFREENGEDVALRVYSRESPGYLRGYAFAEYANGEWNVDQNALARAASSAPLNAQLNDGDRYFRLGLNVHHRQTRRIEVWPEQDHRGVMFVPENACGVIAAVSAIEVSPDQNLRAPELPSGYPYAFLASEQERTRINHHRYLSVPGRELNRILRTIGEQIFVEDATFGEQIDAVCAYFKTNHKYSRRVVPGGLTPLNWFLRTKAAAHCEYFATAATMLLRRHGIPARYVTGFVSPEQNNYEECWMVRNKYAHAWVEAWDEQNARWVTVEPTPGEGVPAARETPGWMRQLWSQLVARFQMLRVRIHQRGILWLLRRILDSWAVRALLLLALIPLSRRAWNRFRRRQRRNRAVDRIGRDFNRLLARLDGRLKRRFQVVRATGETLHQFAERIEQLPTIAGVVPAWYRSYAAARYSSAQTESLRTLRSSLPRV